MPDPFATVFGQEWFVDTDANLVITDQGVFPLEAVAPGVVNGVLFAAPPTFIAGTIALVLDGVLFTRPPTFISGVVSGSVVGVIFLAPPTFISGSVALAGPTTFTGWGIPIGIS